MAEFTLSDGRVLVNVHEPEDCAGEFCWIHNPSDHVMRAFPVHWRSDRSLAERICPHGIGHPDPDHIDWVERVRGPDTAYYEAIHGCDGCCAHGGL